MKELLSLASFLDSLRWRWWAPVACLVVGVFASLAITEKLPKIYRAGTLILVEPQKIPADYVRPTVTTSVENRLRSIQQRITSRSRVERVIQELGLFKEEIGTVPMEALVGRVTSRIQLEIRAQSSFRIFYEGTNPQEVAQVANKVAELFIQENTDARQREARTTTEFLDRELEKVKTKLELGESTMAQFKLNHMGELPEQRDANLRTLEALQLRLRASVEALTRAKDRRLTLESQLSELPAGGASINTMALQLEQARERLRLLLAQYTEQHPEVSLQRREIARLEEALTTAPAQDPNTQAPTPVSLYTTRLKADIDALDSEIKAAVLEQEQIRSDILKYQARVESAPRNEAELSILLRDYDNLRANYQSLLHKRVEATLAENLERERQGEQFLILDRAVPPGSPYKPNVLQIIMFGSVIGLIAGCGLAFVIDLTRPRFRTEGDLVSAYDIPVLATIPRIRTEQDVRLSRKRRLLLAGSGIAVVALTALAIVILRNRQG